MNSRIIKAYIEMKTSQNPNTPLINKNPKALRKKPMHCPSNPKPDNAKQILQK